MHTSNVFKVLTSLIVSLFVVHSSIRIKKRIDLMFPYVLLRSENSASKRVRHPLGTKIDVVLSAVAS